MLENFDFFFDAANQTHKPGEDQGAKKNGKTGIYFLRELLDPTKHTNSEGKACSLLNYFYPDATDLLISGDTGNGYRAYEMLEFLIKVFELFGYKVELIPLAPGHAFNLTDARIAHINTFVRKLLRKSRVFGAEGIARALHTASNPSVARKRTFLSRSHIFFRRVRAEPDSINGNALGAMVTAKDLDKGHMGVRGLLYISNFLFRNQMALKSTHPDMPWLESMVILPG